ncbi:MAG: T9SS type A sorting domain-containing protein [bacterium]
MRLFAALGVLCAMLLVSFPGTATIRFVPGDYSTIQSAIETSIDGDTVLVAAGSYPENINFRGKNIVVASHYLLNQDPSLIAGTVIDGGHPIYPDTGSVVLLISGEDTSAVLMGFTITGGTGTPLRDQVNGLIYVEGGGILCENSSPTIQYNLIIGNQATRRPPGTTSAGGGGIRTGFGEPRILNNVIMGNAGRYGGGVVVNYASALLRNNVVCQNTGGQDYGGSGLWFYGNGTRRSLVQNNTIVGNSSSQTGGGIRVWDAFITCRNNIVWGNRASQGAAQISGTGSQVNATYCCVQGEWTGEGNLGEYPQFADTNVCLLMNSPCVNAGDPDTAYNDADGSRNDMGAYGGPFASLFPLFSQPDMTLPQSTVNFEGGGPGIQVEGTLAIRNYGSGALFLDSVRLGPTAQGVVTLTHLPGRIGPVWQDTLRLVWEANQGLALHDTLFLYHNDPTTANPAVVVLHGNLAGDSPPQRVHELPTQVSLDQNYPNPFNTTTVIRFYLPTAAHVKLEIFDVQGRRVATLIDTVQSAGRHATIWEADEIASGAYLCRLTAESFAAEIQMILVR